MCDKRGYTLISNQPEEQMDIDKKLILVDMSSFCFFFTGSTVHTGPWPPLGFLNIGLALWVGVISPKANLQPGKTVYPF